MKQCDQCIHDAEFKYVDPDGEIEPKYVCDCEDCLEHVETTLGMDCDVMWTP